MGKFPFLSHIAFHPPGKPVKERFGVVNRYDLSKEFPALTLRRTAIKSCTDELLWIWQKKSNNIRELKPLFLLLYTCIYSIINCSKNSLFFLIRSDSLS